MSAAPIRIANAGMRGGLRATHFPGTTLVYVGRGPGKPRMEHAHLGNPYRLPEYDRDAAVDRYAEHLKEQLADPSTHEARKVAELQRRHLNGEDLMLVCWCAPQRCHAEVIAQAIRGEL